MENSVEREQALTERAHDRHLKIQDTIQILKKFGECDWKTRTQWPDYSSFPLNELRTNDLLEIIDGELEGDFDSDGDYWVPVHAWRILAHNKVEPAIPALVDLMIVIDDDDDWAQTELPEIIAAFGVKALPSIRDELLENNLYGESTWGYIGLVTALGKIAANHADARHEVGEILIASLKDFELQPPTLNSFLISELVDLGDPATLPLIQRVFARQFLDETVIDWAFIKDKFLGVDELPQKIKLEKYNINEFHYSGDERFQRLLKTLKSSFNIDNLKCCLLGSCLAIDMVKPSDLITGVLTDLDGNESEFETEGQAHYFYREFFGLWNQLTEVQSKHFELPGFKDNDLNDFDKKSLWSVKLFRLRFVLAGFLEGLEKGNTDADRLEDGKAAEFLSWLEESVFKLEDTENELTISNISLAESLFNEIHTRWNADFMQFAAACQATRRREIEGRKFIQEHKNVGRNESCPCGSEKKFKKCCLAKYH